MEGEGTPMDPNAEAIFEGALAAIRAAGLEKAERAIVGPQGPSVRVAGRAGEALNFCANNYLGMSADPRVIAAAHAALDAYGFGLSSVRFICGTQDVHAALERRIAAFLGTEAAILYSSCFDANGGPFETLLGDD